MPRRFSKSVQRQFDVLRRATRWPVWADLATRLGVAFLLIGIVVFVHWSDRAGLQDSYDGPVSFLDVVYFTMISVPTTGFGDITPVSDRSRLIEAVTVTPRSEESRVGQVRVRTCCSRGSRYNSTKKQI